jgi:hypothetical protein
MSNFIQSRPKSCLLIDSMNAKLCRSNKTKLSADVTTPIARFEKLSLLAELTGQESVKVMYNQNEEYIFGVEGQADIKSNVVRPIWSFYLKGNKVERSIEVECRAELDLDDALNKNFTLSIASSDGTYDLEVVALANTEEVSATLKGSAPLINLREENVAFRLEADRASGKATVDSRGERVFDLLWAADDAAFEGKAKTNIRFLTDVKVKFGQSQQSDGTNTWQASVVREGVEYNANFILQTSGRFMVALDLKTPKTLDPRRHSVQEELPWEFLAYYSHTIGRYGEFDVEGRLHSGENSLTALGALGRGGQSAKAKISLTIPSADLDLLSDTEYDMDFVALDRLVVKTVNSNQDWNFLNLELSFVDWKVFLDAEINGLSNRLMQATLIINTGIMASQREGDILVRWNSSDLFYSNLLWTGDILNKGRFNLQGRSDWHRLPHYEANLEYDVRNEDREASLQFQIDEDNFINLSTKFQFTEDTMTSETLVSSSLEQFHDWKVSASYNIQAMPEASVTLERGNVKKTVALKLNLEHVIPTIDIETPFGGYEKLRFTGKYDNRNGKRSVKLSFERNGQKVISIATAFVLAESGINLSAAAVTQFVGWEELKLVIEANYDNGAYYGTTAKFARNSRVLFLLDGHLSLDDKREFRVEVKTPFTGFESVVLAGRTGSTSVGKSLGVSFDHNRLKREFGIEYSVGEDGTRFELKTPLKQLKRIELRGVRVKRDFDDVTFSFEGEDNMVSLGVRHDFSKGSKSGEVGAELRGMMGDFDFQLDYANLDARYIDQGVTLSAAIKKSGEDMVSVAIRLYTSSDAWKLNIDFTWLTEESWSIVTEFSEAPNMVVKRNGREICKLEASQDFELRRINYLRHILPYWPIGELKAKYSGEDGAFAELEFVLEYQKFPFDIHLSYNSSSPENKSIYIGQRIAQDELDDGWIELNFNTLIIFNDQSFAYSRSYKSDGIQWKSKSITTTNIPWFGFKLSIEEDSFEAKSSKGLDHSHDSFEYKYSWTREGTEIFDMTLKLFVKAKDNIELTYKVLLPWSGKKVKIVTQVKFDKEKAYLRVKTDIPGYEELIGKLGKTEKSGGFEVKALVEKNGEEVTKAAASFSEVSGSVFKSTAILHVGQGFKQKFETNLDFSKFFKSGVLTLGIDAQGTLLDLDTNISADIGVPSNKLQKASVEFSSKGKEKIFTKQSFQSLFKLGWNCLDTYEALLELDNGPALIKIEFRGDMENPENASFLLTIDILNLESLKATLTWDVGQKYAKSEGRIEMGKKWHQLTISATREAPLGALNIALNCSQGGKKELNLKILTNREVGSVDLDLTVDASGMRNSLSATYAGQIPFEASLDFPVLKINGTASVKILSDGHYTLDAKLNDQRTREYRVTSRYLPSESWKLGYFEMEIDGGNMPTIKILHDGEQMEQKLSVEDGPFWFKYKTNVLSVFATYRAGLSWESGPVFSHCDMKFFNHWNAASTEGLYLQIFKFCDL